MMLSVTRLRLSSNQVVTPAKAGVQGKRRSVALDSRFRGNDAEG